MSTDKEFMKNIKDKMRNLKLNDILIWGTVIVFSILYFSLIFNHNVTTDEIFSLNVFKQKIPDIIATSSIDDHPPLYYLYGHIFDLILSQNIQLAKIASIIPAIATLVLIATTFRKKFGDLQALFTLIFFCCVPCTMEYAVQIRMYTLSIFFVTLCGLEAYLCYTENKKKNWILMCVGGLGAAYTVYFAFVAVCFEIGILFIFIIINSEKRKTLIKSFIISAIVMIALYLPWVPVLLSRTTTLSSDYFLPPISFSEIWSYFTWTFDLETVPGFVFLFIALLSITGIFGILHIVKKKKNYQFVIAGFCAMLIPTLTVAFGVIVSLCGSTIYTGRYVIIEMMMLAIYFGMVLGTVVEERLSGAAAPEDEGASSVEKEALPDAVKTMPSTVKTMPSPVKMALGIAMTVLALSGIGQYYECFKQEYVGHLTDETVKFFKEHLGPNDYILYNYEAMGFEYRFYFPNDRLFYVRDFDFNTDYENLWFMSNMYEWPISDADCYTYWISKEYIGVYGIEDNNFELYRFYHNDFPKIEP